MERKVTFSACKQTSTQLFNSTKSYITLNTIIWVLIRQFAPSKIICQEQHNLYTLTYLSQSHFYYLSNSIFLPLSPLLALDCNNLIEKWCQPTRNCTTKKTTLNALLYSKLANRAHTTPAIFHSNVTITSTHHIIFSVITCITNNLPNLSSNNYIMMVKKTISPNQRQKEAIEFACKQALAAKEKVDRDA